MTIELIIKIIQEILKDVDNRLDRLEMEINPDPYMKGMLDGKELAYEHILEMLKKIEIKEIGQEDVMGEGLPW